MNVEIFLSLRVARNILIVLYEFHCLMERSRSAGAPGALQPDSGAALR